MLRNSIRAAAVLAALLALRAGPANAASDTCFVTVAYQWCRTASIPAHPVSHHVHATLSPRLNFEVRDDNNGVRVYSGYAGITGRQKTITGLYSRYSMLVLLPRTNTWGWGTLDNN